MADERDHVNHVGTESQVERRTIRYEVFECRHCEETFTLESDLPFEEVRDRIRRHVAGEHPETM